MSDIGAPSLLEQIDCVKREIRLREIVYPKQVAKNTMAQSYADRELARMKEVLETLHRFNGLMK